MEKPTSTDQTDYEILIRRYDNGANYASYCPQLAHMIKGTAHEEVENLMKEYILSYIASLENTSTEQTSA
jgi:hypothetical protein